MVRFILHSEFFMISMASLTRLSLLFGALMTSQASWAAGKGIDIRQAALTDVVHTYYQVMSRSPYVICPSVTSALGKVSVRAPSTLTKQALRTLLRVNGFRVTTEHGIDVICDAEGQRSSASVTVGAPAPAGLDPYGRPSNIPSGSPLDQPEAIQASVDVEERLIAPPPATTARFVYRVRHRAAEELLPMLQALDLGSFSVLGLGTARVDGSTSSTLGGQAGDMILWSGLEDDEDAVRDLVDQIDQPAARAYVEIAAMAVSDVDSRSRSLSLVGDLLGLGSLLGSQG